MTCNEQKLNKQFVLHINGKQLSRGEEGFEPPPKPPFLCATDLTYITVSGNLEICRLKNEVFVETSQMNLYLRKNT